MSYNPRTTDKYVKVKKQSEKAPENEIRIRAVPRIGRYISYAATLLLEKKLSHVIIKASGNATKSACQIAEILRHRILGLHQLNHLKTVGVVDEYEPKEEGLDKVVVERKLAVLEIHLSLNNDAFKTTDPGYQAPLPKEEVQEEELKSLLEGGRRGGERPERGERERGERGERGTRRGGRGRGRGGFRRGRYSGARGGRGGRTGGYEEREDDYNGGYRGGRGRGGFRGSRGGDRGDRGERGTRGGERGSRGTRGGSRGGSRGGNRGDRY